MKKQIILSHFNGDFTPFYSKFCGDLHRAGKGYKTLCPFHDDKTPSLSINPGTGLFNCFGCRVKGNIFDFYGKRNSLSDFLAILNGIAADFGISDNGIKPERTVAHKNKERLPAERKQLVKTYDYLNPQGSIQSQKLRYDPKDFRLRRPDGRGGWIYNMDGVEPVLYNLPAVIKTDKVWIVEGEKDADSLNGLGFTATTNFDGAGKWRDSYNLYFKDKDVILIPDDDAPGRAHMQKVAAALHGVAASVKILNLPNSTGKKGFDVSDFIAEQADPDMAAEMLNTLAAAAECYPDPDPIEIQKAILRPAVLESEEFISKEMPEKVLYLDPWLSALSIILITGSRGIGKSWFLLSLLLAISKQKAFGPWAAVNSAPCLYLDGEMAAQDLQTRLIALDQDGVKASPLHIYSDAYASSQGLPRANLLNPAWRNDMKSLLLDLGVKVWAVDNIASLTPGIDENSKQEWDPINQWLLELRFNEITTALAHHTNRSGGQRGTSGREDNIDISILLKQPEGYTAEDGASFIVSFTKARIAIPHLSKIADTAFHMQQGVDGKTVWTWGAVKQQRNSKIIELYLEGIEKKEIAKELSCSIQNVHQVIKRHENS